jgi:hypothetical protein
VSELIDVTDTARAMGYECPVSVESTIPAAEVAEVLAAARDAAAGAAMAATVSAVPFRIVRTEGGVIRPVEMVLVLLRGGAGATATILTAA